MKNIVIINGIGLNDYSRELIVDSKSSYDLAVEYSNRLPDIEEIYVLTDIENLTKTDNLKVILKKEWSILKLLDIIKEISAGYDNIFYYYADCPLMDADIGIKMFENHKKYFAQYSFADGYPYGLTPEILSTNIISALLLLAQKLPENGKTAVLRDSIFTVIMKDINSFDIETEISPEDLRLYRIYLTSDTKRNFIQLKNIISSGGNNAESITGVIKEKEILLRSLPAFFNIQIFEGCPQECSYCPYPKSINNVMEKQKEMAIEDFKKIIKDIKSSFDDAVISISLWGEPSLHSRIDEIIDIVLMHEKMSLVIETSGIGWDLSVLQKIIEKARVYSNNSLNWIISLDALDPDIYKQLRGEGQAEAINFTKKLLSINKKNVHIQAVRMKTNEEDLESFYRHWKEFTDNIIIQKYDHFSRTLPDEKVTDLSPLERNACWHIKRDMHILLDGSVPMCREDIKNEFCYGNVFKESISEIWENSLNIYIKHIKAQYPELCKNCDEYYTYNF